MIGYDSMIENRFFESIGLSLAALIFLIIIMVRYFHNVKGHDRNISFEVVMFSNMLLLISDFAYVYSMAYLFESNMTMVITTCHINMLLILFTLGAFVYYAIALLASRNGKNIEGKNKIIILIFLALLFAVITILDFQIPVEYFLTENKLYTYGGSGTIALYAITALLFIILFVSIGIYWKNMERNQRIAIIYSFGLVVVLLGYQMITNTDYNSTSFLLTNMIISLYLTIESQDSRQIKKLQDTKNLALRNDSYLHNFLNVIIFKIKKPINSVISICNATISEEKINKNELNDDAGDIKKTTDNISVFMKSIKDMYFFEKDNIEFNNTNFNISDLVLDIKTNLLSQINSDKTFDIKISDNVPSTLYGDSNKINRIITDILLYLIKINNNTNLTIGYFENNIKLTYSDVNYDKNIFDMDNDLIDINNMDNFDVKISIKFIDKMGGNITLNDKLIDIIIPENNMDKEAK